VRLNSTTRTYFTEMARFEQGQMQQDMRAVAAAQPDPAAVKRLQRQPLYNAIQRTTCVATMIEGGHAENALPQRARAMIQCRMLPDDSQQAVQALLAKAINDNAVRISVVTPAAPGPESVPSPALMAKIKGVVGEMWPNVPLVPDMDTGASDSKYTRGAGIPSFGITGMFIDIDDVRAHGRDERILIGNYYQDVEFTYRLLKALAAE
jgi:acetylornithine deacetylase/succinyl-diaminopimelate desuccinylase-like protein